MTFNPVARRGDPDWRVMYLGVGDSGSGEQKDIRRINPQRLDTLVGKILRIVPDLREHTTTSTVSENGRYRIPNDNPFTALEGARKEIWAYGLRNPHRLIWDVDPAHLPTPRAAGVQHRAHRVGNGRHRPQGRELRLLAARRHAGDVPGGDGRRAGRRHDSGADHRHGHARHGQADLSGHSVPAHAASGGDAIAGGFIYRGSRIPALRGKLVFGDITTGRIWYAERADVWRPTTATRRQWRRFTRSTPVCAASWKRRTARAAARARRCPAPPPSRAAAVWICGSRSTTPASSMS